MDLRDKNILITGGAGFIGYYLIKNLIGNNNIFVYDNLSTGNKKNLSEFIGRDNFEFERGNLLDFEKLRKFLDPSIDLVFHLAANPDVKIGVNDTKTQFQDLKASKNLLDLMRVKKIKNIVFTSSSVVYGPADLPTSEDHPTRPISIYGASKLSIESFIQAYNHTFNINAWIFRLANIVGKRGHGVILDFIKKLEKNPNKLKILGDGNQAKSYLYVKECINAMKFVIKNKESHKTKIYNIGSDDLVKVTEIANIIIKEMNLDPKKVEFEYTGGRKGRGWKGDVKRMFLDNTKLKSLGWTKKTNSKRAIRKTVRSILKEKN